MIQDQRFTNVNVSTLQVVEGTPLSVKQNMWIHPGHVHITYTHTYTESEIVMTLSDRCVFRQ